MQDGPEGFDQPLQRLIIIGRALKRAGFEIFCLLSFQFLIVNVLLGLILWRVW